MTSYVAKTPLVLARDDEDRFVYIYQGGQVPPQVTQAEVDRLVEGGHLAKAEPTAPTLVKK